MPNGINDISPDLRDWLLNKNLILADSITNGGLASLGVGLGQQAQTETLPNAVQASTSIVDNGQFYRDLNLLANPYKALNGNDEIDINTNTVINIGNLPPGTQPLGYQQNVGSNNPTSPFNVEADEAREQMLKNKYFDADYLYKVNLNTVFISPNPDGVYHFKQSLAARAIDTALNAVNLGGVAQQVNNAGLPNTQLETIADQQLINHFGYNAGAGLLQETLGHINANPLSLLQGNDIFVPNFTLTVPKTALGSVADFGAKVLGFEVPVSLLDPSASIFSSENSVDNIARASAMIANTGKGQVLAMIDNLNQNKFKPTITEDRKRISVTKGDTGTNGELYAFEATEPGRILDLLNTTPKSAADNDIPPSEDEYTTAQDAPDKRGFEEKYGKITSELTGGYNDEFDDLNQPPIGLGSIDEKGTTKYIWGDEEDNKPTDLIYDGDVFGAPKSLLFKTQELFKTNKMRTLTSGHGSARNKADEVQSAVHNVAGGKYTSKGSGVLSSEAALGNLTSSGATPENVYCRTWTTLEKYNQVRDLQKSRGLDANAGSTIRNNGISSSVLDDNGFVRIAPKVGDGEGAADIGDTKIKRFMFSIENLAWNGFQPFLPNCEKGPGDPITGTRGRIMWFPPYGMNFTDNTAVNWDTTNFIGRGEPIYTYNNTERTGTLQWQMIIDHATYINDLRGADASDEIFASIAAGCMDLDSIIGSKLSSAEKNEIEVQTAVQPQEVEVEPQIPPAPYKVYFPNDRAAVPTTYENGDGVGLGSIMADEGYVTTAVNGSVHPYPDNTDFGLNSCSSGNTAGCPQGQKIELDGKTYDGWRDNSYMADLTEYLINKCPACRISLSGWASQDGQSEAAEANQRLSNDRATHVANQFKTLLKQAGDPIADDRFEFIQGEGATGCPAKKKGDPKNEVDVYCKKTSRFTQVSFTYDPTLDEKLEAAAPPIVEPPVRDISLEIRARYFNECSYFQKIEQEDAFVYASIKEKVKFFHPAFHSITPEGFNSRLNFLQQCTRQGPTIRKGSPTNMAFGTPPVCILRIGDFYHTKIVINNIAFSFDPLVWDLNPEGVGVQPMLCTVDMSFKFIGGSSLQGPINRLQNAVSFNYFANTEIYDNRADFIRKATAEEKSEDPEAEYVLVNGLNPNSYGLTPPATSDPQLSSGINDRPEGEIDQEARVEEDIAASPPEEVGNTDKDIIVNTLQFMVQTQSDGKLLCAGTGNLTALSKDYPVKLKLMVGGRPTDIGNGNISNQNDNFRITTDKEWKSAIIAGSDGDKYTFQVTMNIDGEWVPTWTSYLGATSSCENEGVDAGDLLTQADYDAYKESKSNDECNN